MKIIAKFRSVTPYYWDIGAGRLGTSLLALVTWPRGTERWGAEVIPITIPIIKPGHSAEQPLPGSHTTRPHCIGDPITLTCYSSASWCPYQCTFIYYFLPVGYFNYYWVFCNVSSINRSIRTAISHAVSASTTPIPTPVSNGQFQIKFVWKWRLN